MADFCSYGECDKTDTIPQVVSKRAAYNCAVGPPNR